MRRGMIITFLFSFGVSFGLWLFFGVLNLGTLLLGLVGGFVLGVITIITSARREK
jgi:hypothetical protein